MEPQASLDVGSGSAAAASETVGSMVVPECARCKVCKADFECFKCLASFCSPCWDGTHEWGENEFHEQHALKKPTVPCEGSGPVDCPTGDGAVAYCGVCDQLLCLSCWEMVHCKGTRACHEKLPPLGRAAFQEEQLAVKAAGGKAGPLAGLAAFDPKKTAPWVGQLISQRKGTQQARLAGLGVTVKSGSGVVARASAGVARYTAIQAQAPQAIAEQLQKVCEETGSGAFSDACIKAYASDRQADVDTLTAILKAATSKSSAGTDERNQTLCDKVEKFEIAIKAALAAGKEVALSKDAKGQGLERMEKSIAKTAGQLEALQVSSLAVNSSIRMHLS